MPCPYSSQGHDLHRNQIAAAKVIRVKVSQDGQHIATFRNKGVSASLEDIHITNVNAPADTDAIAPLKVKNDIKAASAFDHKGIAASATRHAIAPPTAIQQVVAPAPVKAIITALAQELVVAIAANQLVIAAITNQQIIATLTVKVVFADPPPEPIIAAVAKDLVIASAADQEIITTLTKDGVIAIHPSNLVVPFVTIEAIALRRSRYDQRRHQWRPNR